MTNNIENIALDGVLGLLFTNFSLGRQLLVEPIF